MTLQEGKERLICAILRPINPASVVFLGIYTVVWGLWVASPCWTVFTQAEIYGWLGILAPEWFWGSLAIICGLVTIYGAIKRNYKPLVRGVATAAWHWFMITIFYFLGDPLNTAGITALAFALYAVFIFLNLRVNYKNDKKNPEILH